MKLIFLVQKEAWFVEHAQAWYRLADKRQTGLALAGLALNMVNQHELIEQPHQAGTASIRQTDERTLTVTLSHPEGQLIESIDIRLDENILLNVDWATKPYRDGWMSADARLTLDNVGSMHVEAYLPARSGSEGKTLTIADPQTGSAREVWIKRDQTTRVAIVENGTPGKVDLILRCEPEQIDQTSDPRQLGFVVVGEQAHPA